MILILILVFSILCLVYYIYSSTNKKSKCWINTKNYPCSEYLFNNRDIIRKELYSVINTNLWSIWSNDYNTTPIFSMMSDQDILKRLNDSKGKISSNKNSSWRLFSLILNRNILPDAKYCPNTIKLLQSCSNKVINAGFSLLEPYCYIGSHRDINDTFYRLHIPLIIPKNNNKLKSSFINDDLDKLCILQVENDYRIWKDDEYFIFDDTCEHNAWNYTNEYRFILIVDIEK